MRTFGCTYLNYLDFLLRSAQDRKKHFFGEFKEQNSGTEHENQKNDPIFSSTNSVLFVTFIFVTEISQNSFIYGAPILNIDNTGEKNCLFDVHHSSAHLLTLQKFRQLINDCNMCIPLKGVVASRLPSESMEEFYENKNTSLFSILLKRLTVKKQQEKRKELKMKKKRRNKMTKKKKKK